MSVLVLHDVRALVYERQASTASSPWARWALRREGRRYQRFEREYCQRYDLVVTVSPADEAWVRTHYRPARLATVAIPVDTSYFGPISGLSEARARVVFTGVMDHPPNADAAVFFARQVLPRVQAAVPEAEFWIVGRDPAPAVRRLALIPGVVVTGFVEDMRPYIAQATVVVVPLRFGSGMRNKILEAWAMEKCVIATRVGAEGLGCADGTNILLADDGASLARCVIEALRTPELRDRIRGGGRALVSTAHDPEALARRYHQVVEATVEEQRGCASPLRAAVDVHWMRRGGGDERHRLFRSLVNHLLRGDGADRYTVLAGADARSDFGTRGRSSVRFVATDGPGARVRAAVLRATRGLHRRLGYQHWRTPEVEALRRARALDAEVALAVCGLVHPDVGLLTRTLAVLDVEHEIHPELFSPRDLDARGAWRAAARRAASLCAFSEFTRQALIEALAVAPDRVTAIQPAADPMFHPGSRARREGRRVLDRHGLKRGDYLLLQGSTSPAGNQRVAYRALRVLRDDHGVVRSWSAQAIPTNSLAGAWPRFHDAGLGERVRFLGPCPATDLPGLYAGAGALVVPSLCAGVGLPLLEAMWCDCPVVCSNAGSLPEVAGPAALLVDPRSPEELAQALSRVLTDENLRRALIQHGRQRAQDFSGEKFALAVASALRAARQLRYG